MHEGAIPLANILHNHSEQRVVQQTISMHQPLLSLRDGKICKIANMLAIDSSTIIWMELNMSLMQQKQYSNESRKHEKLDMMCLRGQIFIGNKL